MKWCIGILSIVLVVLNVPESKAQDLAAEFEGMYHKLEQLKSFRFIVDYGTSDTTQFNDKGKVSVLATPQGYFYEMGFCELLINKQHTILINEEDRTIIYSDNSKLEKKEPRLDFSHLLNGVDSLIKQADSVYFSFNGLDRIYYLRFSDHYFNLVELHFTNDMLRHINYYYNPTYVEETDVTASNDIELIENPDYNPELFDSRFYFTRENGNTIPTDTFSNYGLIYNESTEELLK